MSIKNLIEISSLVTKARGSGSIHLSENELTGDSSKYIRLIDGLAKGTWKSDEEAELEIYGKVADGKTFEMLKSRAKEKLVNLIFQSDASRLFSGEGDKAYFNACKCFLTGTLLFYKDK